MQKLAIIGTGIAGMSCGYFLRNDFELAIYEKNDYAGGHTNTIAADEDEGKVFFDTGFMVFNHVTYPLLTKLFGELKVETKKTSMSFSVQHVPSGLEYCGSGLNGLFAQRKNLFNFRFIRMLKEISRFNSASVKWMNGAPDENLTIAQFCAELGLGNDFLHRYLVPMSGAVWSTPPEKMEEFPALTLVRFFYNHGFLGLNTQHQWYTVEGGSRMYRDKLIAPYKEKIMTGNAAVSVKREGGKVKVVSADGAERMFDKVIFASHGDETLRMLADATGKERALLSCFRYEANKATVHTDGSVMPRTKRAWSSWNYRITQEDGKEIPSTIYWMNSLQGVSGKKDYFVSINGAGEIDRSKVIAEIDYTHPLFDVPAMRAQKELPLLNESGPVYFCGSYFRYGFHEDALLSSVMLCEKLTGRKVL
ncbi:MAG TPA: FAD-dependent oxidoreductase [Bacteroidia bacterium]|nr:FAD-dependent oxidoreductase [Bacteroidia bacterium]